MHAEESRPLDRRVADLEHEVRALRKRVAALEGLEFTETPSVPLHPVPLEPQALVGTVAGMSAPPTPPSPVPAVSPASAGLPVLPPPIPASVAPKPAAPVLPQVAVAAPLPLSTPSVSSTPPPPPAEPPPPSALVELLDALHLLPPSGQRAGEAGIGAWWATRIGAIILVIGVVFLGVYVSLTTPPWVRLLELAAIAVGMTGAGLWLESRMGRIGSVVMGAGLALCYFATFAAYAVPAVKVIESVGTAAVVQALAVVAIAGVAMWRRSETVATMAVLLGFVSAFFSMSAGFDDFAVAAGLGLAGVAVFFRKRELWGAPVLTSAALVHVLNATVAVYVWNTEIGRRSPWFAFAIVGAAWALHFASVVLEGPGGTGKVATIQRWIQSLNTSLGVMAGFAAALQVLPKDDLSWYFFGAGAVLLGAAAWAWRAVPGDGLFGMFAVKASSLIALGVILEWDARTRWVALLVQAGVLMAAAARSRRISLALTSLVTWIVSLLYFCADIDGLQGQLISGAGIAVVLYLAGGSALLAWMARWIRERDQSSSGASAVAWVLGVAAAVPVVMTLAVTWEERWLIVACVVCSVGLIGMARILRSIVPAVGAVVAMLAAHVLVQRFDVPLWGGAWLWAGASLIAIRSAALAWIVGAREDDNVSLWHLASVTLTTLAIAAVGGALMQTVELYPAFACSLVVAAGIVAIGARLGRSDLAVGGVFAVSVLGGLWMWHAWHAAVGDGPSGWLWLAAACVPGALAMSVIWPGREREMTALRGLTALVGVILVWSAATHTMDSPTGFVWSIVAAAAVYAALGRWKACGASTMAASALLLADVAHYLGGSQAWARGEHAMVMLLSVFLVLVAVAVLPLLQSRGAANPEGAARRLWRIAHAVIAMLGLLWLATLGRSGWAEYGSVVWALGGVALFVIGLLLRARSHRVAGLAMLALCIPRVFLYDIQSTRDRIAAFVVLGLLLLAVGFFYQKFRHLVEATPEASQPEPQKPGADLKRDGR